MNRVNFNRAQYNNYFVAHRFALDLEMVIWLNKHIGKGSSDLIYTDDIEQIRMQQNSWQAVFWVKGGKATGLWIVFHNDKDALHFKLRWL